MIRRHLVPLAVTLGLLSAFFVSAYAQHLSPETLPNEPATESALPYDVLVYATFGEPSSLDPAWDYETSGVHMIQQIYEPLITLYRDQSDDLIPVLATDWGISPDQQVYTFTIRQGVQFHNGSALTAEDVAYSFQRGVLQGSGGSPQWLFTEAYFGTGIYDIACLVDGNDCQYEDDPDGLQTVDPATLLSVCEQVTSTIVADEANWTVSFHLAQPWSPFLNTLVGSWGSILDKDWTIANGGWDGDCATWQYYYGESPLGDTTNGTGPFMLDHWTPGVEFVLSRNDNYWRQEPMWEGGPTGPARFSEVVRTIVPTETVRMQMLLDGDADLVTLSPSAVASMTDDVLLSYSEPDGVVSTLEHPTGTLKYYYGGLATSASDAFFVYDIQTGGDYNFIGSGALDGNGIPPDFFTDIHVRKAFNYAFDWDEYIDTALEGAAIQRTGPIIKPLPGYTETQPTYHYSPTLAMQEFSQAWGGDVVSNGFVLTITYNEGNLTRQTVAEILKENIESLDQGFQVNILPLPYTVFNAEIRASRVPVFIHGWGQDIPHPYNWAQPWLLGAFGNWQRLPDPMHNVYEAMINGCMALVGDAARACWEDIQVQTHTDAKDIYLAQAYDRQMVRAEVQGYYHSADGGRVNFYMLSKGPIPTHELVEPGVGETIIFTTTHGAEISAVFGTSTVTETMQIVATPDIVTFGRPEGFRLGDLTFGLDAYGVDGSLIENPTFNEPMTLTIEYTDAMVSVLDEETLQLFWWDGESWVDAACGEVVIDTVNNILTVPICHLSDFAIGGETFEIALPIVAKH